MIIDNLGNAIENIWTFFQCFIIKQESETLETFYENPYRSNCYTAFIPLHICCKPNIFSILHSHINDTILTTM